MDGIADSMSHLTVDRAPVYLLKTSSLPSDAYEEHLNGCKDISLEPIFVPVLHHHFRDDTLRALQRHAERFAFAGGSAATARQKATNNPSKRYGGLIFTSQRAVDAFGYVVKGLQNGKVTNLFDKDMPIYVVGPATAQGVEALGLPCPVVGFKSGNGEALAKFILQHHATLPRDATHLNGVKLPLLFPVGEQRRDIIPANLNSLDLEPSERIAVQELIVYETGEMATFEETFTTYLHTPRALPIRERFVVVFSPQGCEGMLNALGWLDRSGNYNAEKRIESGTGTKTYIITIGPTTHNHLTTVFGFPSDRCATEPTPNGVLDAIKSLHLA